MRIGLTDDCGRGALLEVAVRRDTLEFRCQSHRWSVFDKVVLREWLSEPDGLLIGDELVWAWTPIGVLLTIEGVVSGWPVPREALEDLLAAVTG